MTSVEGGTTVYTVLSRAFTYPLDIETLALCRALSVDETLGRACAEVRQALAEMKAAIDELRASIDDIEMLNQEATRLFEGPGQPLAPPFGSFYRNGRTLMGPEAIAVRQAYLAALMVPDDDGRVPPDHLAVELGFMAALGEAMNADDPRAACVAARHFLATHLLTWIPAWRADVLAARPHPFFSSLATVTQRLLEADLVWLDDIIPALALDEVSVVGDER